MGFVFKYIAARLIYDSFFSPKRQARKKKEPQAPLTPKDYPYSPGTYYALSIFSLLVSFGVWILVLKVPERVSTFTITMSVIGAIVFLFMAIFYFIMGKKRAEYLKGIPKKDPKDASNNPDMFTRTYK